MKRAGIVLVAAVALRFCAAAQTPTDTDFKLALPEHRGQLSWSAEGFKVIQSSAKPEGREIGIRGKDQSGRLTFLGFLFLVPEQAPLTSAKCRDGVVEPLKKSDPGLKIETAEKASLNSPSIAMAKYAAQGRGGRMVYAVRGFVATDDICGDLDLYSDTPISADGVVQKIFASYRFDQNYSPQFDSVLFYAQTLYQAHMYKAAAPMFEVALVKLKENPDMAARMLKDKKTATRVVTDQAGMAYGMSGNIQKARSLFEKAIVEDPDYPLNYYNLACADAEEKNLADARTHLQQAFARKANVISGESMPDPTKDDSFLPYRDNKEFWAFLETLQPR
jgi:hypothetical protein